ncbi:glycoside hydrolase superfamily [Dipodascopsis uninucleata]
MPAETRTLPNDFLWGYATASYQVEGAVAEDGRLPSIWDTFSHLPGKTLDGKSGDLATDSYKRWKEDIALMKSYGVSAYRFSLSWSRIIPLGGRNDPINPKGIDYYRNFIQTLLDNGIEPMVTLFHWDLPQALQDKYEGFLSRDIVPDFVNYAKVCFENFGDIVKYWITINEPNVFSILGHCIGGHAPGRTSDRTKSPVGNSLVEPFVSGHNLLLAHAAAVKVFREGQFNKKKDSEICIVINANWGEPWNDSEECKKAAADFRVMAFEWFSHPVYVGDYHPRLRELIGDRLPVFTEDEINSIKGSSDYFGLNHYTTYLVKPRDKPVAENDWQSKLMGEHIEVSFTRPDGTEIGPKAGLSWVRPVPFGFKKLLEFLYSAYGKTIYITENGVICPEERYIPKEQALEDDFRIEYFQGYIDVIIDLQGKVPVGSYIIWSLMDNFEWQEGFTRFGVTWIDFEDDNKRYPKKSAGYIREFMRRTMVD